MSIIISNGIRVSKDKMFEITIWHIICNPRNRVVSGSHLCICLSKILMLWVFCHMQLIHLQYKKCKHFKMINSLAINPVTKGERFCLKKTPGKVDKYVQRRDSALLGTALHLWIPFVSLLINWQDSNYSGLLFCGPQQSIMTPPIPLPVDKTGSLMYIPPQNRQKNDLDLLCINAFPDKIVLQPFGN